MGELQAGKLLVEVAEGVHGDNVAGLLVAVQVPTLAVVVVLLYLPFLSCQVGDLLVHLHAVLELLLEVLNL